jgi:hypothetical protein
VNVSAKGFFLLPFYTGPRRGERVAVACGEETTH